MKSKARKQAEKRGRRAEFLAACWLRIKGYRIISRRFKTKAGEIDIIASKKNTLVIVEVKQRSSLEAGHAALHASALKRIETAALIFQNQSAKFHNFEMRFDVIFILPAFRMVHTKDAWRRY